MAKDFSHRTKATQRYAGTTAGFYNDFVHLSSAQSNYPITPGAGYVLQRIVFNTAPSVVTNLKVGSDILASISTTAATGDKTYNCYLYDQLFYSGDGDVTFIITKGTSAPNA